MSELKPGDPAPPFRLQPVSGLPVEVGLQGPVSMLFFLRPLASAHSRLLVNSLQQQHTAFDGIQVVQFTRSVEENVRDFVPRHHILLPIVNDLEGRWYDAYGVGRDRGFVRSMTDLSGWMKLPQTLLSGMGRPEGFYDQRPAAFVIGVAGRVAWAWYGSSVLALPDPAEMLAVARRELAAGRGPDGRSA